MELCLYDVDSIETRIALPEVDGFVWHGFIPNIEPGQRYGYRVCGAFEWDQSLFGYPFGEPDSRNDDDSAAAMPKCVVINP